MEVTTLLVKCIVFLASLTLGYSRHIFSLYNSYNSYIKLMSSHNSNDVSLCTTPGCVKTAAAILSNLNESVDPCDNFYRFACGGWLSSHVIPKGKIGVSTFTLLEDDLKLKLKTLMEKELDGTEPPFAKMLKDMYDSCMDLETIEMLGSEPLKKDLERLGGWPVLEGSKWDESSFDWVDTLIAFRRLGYDFHMLISMSVKIDYRNNTFHIVSLKQAILDMPHREYLVPDLSHPGIAAFYKLGVKSAELLGAAESVAETELLQALIFQLELIAISTKDDERKDFSKMYNKYTVAELQNMIPQIPWLKYFNGMLDDEIDETEIVLVGQPEYLKNLAKLLQNTEKRVLANYMFWRIVLQSMSLLSEEWRDSVQEHFSIRTGLYLENPRWEYCISSSTKYFGPAFGSYYVRHYFKEDSKDAALELVKYIHKEFLNILQDSDWMDYMTKKEALAKANSMKAHIGYPEELLNATAVTEIYKNLTIYNRSFYQNVMNIRKYAIDYTFSHLRKPVIKGEWVTYSSAAVVNAFYSRIENSIKFPAGILQGFFFDKDRPHYMNFGAIGMIIGHEITHGFDDKGRQFDKDGNNLNWWDKTTDKLFHKRAQCIIDQYSNYTAENGMKLDGVKTQSDDIADNGGLKAAYKAYQSWVKENGPEPLLPGLKYTQDQLFFLSTANMWCAKNLPKATAKFIWNGKHSLQEYRVIGPMSNLPEFSKAFNCPPDSPMNNRNKCQVW